MKVDSIYSTVRTSEQILECTQAALPNNSKNDATKNCFTNDCGVRNGELFRIMQKYKDFFILQMSTLLHFKFIWFGQKSS